MVRLLARGIHRRAWCGIKQGGSSPEAQETRPRPRAPSINMTWLTFLSNTSALVTITANVIVIFYVFPAFKQTKRRALVLLGSACLLGIFDTLCDHTIGSNRMAHDDYVIYRTLRWFAHLVATGLETTGIVLLTQSYLRSFQPEPPSLPEEKFPR